MTSEQKEFQHLQAVFPANGFLAELVRKTLLHQTRPTPLQPVHEDAAEPQKIMCLSYIRVLSERIERVCTPLGVKAAFKPAKTLRQTLMNVKNCIPEEKEKEVVMSFPARSATYPTLGKRSKLESKNWGAQAGRERGGSEEWHSSSRPPIPTYHQLGRCQSEEKCEWILEEKYRINPHPTE